MKKVLIITSRKAYPMLLEAVKEIEQQLGREYDITIKDLPIDVIALATREFLKHHLIKLDLSSYDYVVIPGTVKHDLRRLSEEIGVKIIKSPTRISLLKTMFLIGLEKFSPSISGDEVIKKNLAILLDKAYSYYARISKGVKVGDLVIPFNPPPFIVGFYLDHKWMGRWIKKYIQKYRPHILYIPSDSFEFIQNYIELDNYILAIPTDLIKVEDIGDRAKILYGLSPSQIRDYMGLDYILQVNISDPAEIEKIMGDWGESANIIYNLVIPSTKNILKTLYGIKHYNKAVISTWITSISSLFDIDSHSLHAFLMELFREAGISLVIVAEFEEKLFWSLREVMVSKDLITLSTYLGTEPRDLGLDLLYVKDKEYYDIDLGMVDKVIIAEDEINEPYKYKLDPLGIFKIKVNHREEYIETLYIGRKGRILIKGKTEEAIRRIILREKLISLISHAFYLGKELGKAEEALRIGKNYEQEKPLLRKPETLKSK
ncbi:MAG: hypothetical protein J7J82_07180 [Staphylothermus sp.]|nr:hypothetical protein [Staphylothermus sp.]